MVLVFVRLLCAGAKDNHLACGVVARSAGLFQNPKHICQCDGRTIWSEDTSGINWTKEAAAVETNTGNG